MVRFAGLLLCTLGLFAQAPPKPQTDSVVVTGAFEPIPLEETDRAVQSWKLDDQQRVLINTLFDLLRLDPAMDVRGRAPNGVQTDVSIRGGGFGQTLVLLNGLRLNDAQSGHHNFDVPIPADLVDRVEVLRGAGSTMYGSDAIAGVVNVITRTPESSEIRIRSALGNFGVNQESLSGVFARKNFVQSLAVSRDFSSGFAADRDYRNLSMASLSHWRGSLGAGDLTLAMNDRPFGGDQFYGNFNSWERTRTWFAALSQQIGANTTAAFAYRRHTDLFVLYRDRPSVFENRHSDESYQASVRRHDRLSETVSLNYGVEGYRDSVESTNLGNHDRARGAGYVALDLRALRRFSFSIGGREEFFTGGRKEFSPTISAGAWLSPQWKLRGSASRAFRLPSYTDLYYHDPANIGSPDLRPESAWGFEGGVEWTPKAGRIRADATLFHRREKDDIDYVRKSPTDIYRATNFQRLNFTGVEAAVTVALQKTQWLDVRYTSLHGIQDVLGGLQSKYTFNYPRNSGIVGWRAALPHGFLIRTRIGVLDRLGRDPYAVWDAYAAKRHGRWTPFIQFTNLTATTYQEIIGVRTPGRGVVGGIEFRTAW
ncbi:MAG: TonB-dependent receptor [Bryobacteraceae bacterium]